MLEIQMNVLAGLKKLFLKNILDIMNKHKRFSNIQKIGTGRNQKVYQANQKNSEQYLASKSFFLRLMMSLQKKSLMRYKLLVI